MKTLIIYYSNYKNNTEIIAKTLANKINADLINLKNVSTIEFENYNLIGFGSGVYKENLSPKLFKLVENSNLKNKKVFVFSTSGIGLAFYNKKLIKLLVSKGAMCKGSFACKGQLISKEFSKIKIFEIVGKLSKNHPNEKDLKKAEKFIEKVYKSIH